jgi:cobalt-zinc-cadmium efflux system outer membrane protein
MWRFTPILLLVSGCLLPIHEDMDGPVVSHSGAVVDAYSSRWTDATLPASSTAVVQPQAVKEHEPKTLAERLKLPAGLPGEEVQDIKLPPLTAKREEVQAAIQKYFPALPPLPVEPRAEPGPEGCPLTLADLQKLALTNSPVFRQAVADLEAARGAALQARLGPNPRVGYEGDTIHQADSAGIQGGFIEQTIKTGGKLRLSYASAMLNVRASELKVEQTEAEVRTQVRSGYFAVLVAKKNLEVTRALGKLTDEIYRVLVLQLQAGEVATYEPMQVRVLALQARGLVIQAHNRYVAAWKQLASSLGLPGMPLTQVAGRIDMPIPRYTYEEVLAQVLQRHTEVLSAQTSVDKAQVDLRLAQVQNMPDVDLRYMVQKDYTTPPFGTVHSVVVGMQVPIFDRNQGHIRQAQALLLRATEQAPRVRAELTARLAEAFERYENNRALLDLYRTQMIPNQVQAFRATVARHFRGGEKAGVSYNDLVTAEQTLVGLITNYINTLRDQWTAVVDVAGVLQTRDLFQTGDNDEVAPVPELDGLFSLDGRGLDSPPLVNLPPPMPGPGAVLGPASAELPRQDVPQP